MPLREMSSALRAALTFPLLAADLILGACEHEHGYSIGEVTAAMRPPAPAGWHWREDGLLYRDA